MPTSHLSPASRRLARLFAGLGAAVVSISSLHAVDYYKANNTTNLNVNAAWVDLAGAALATTPGNTNTSPDSWIWDNRVQILAVGDVPPVFNLGNDLGVRNIVIKDPAYPVTIDGGGNRSILLATGGSINLTEATQNLTLQNLNTASNAVGLRMPGSNTVLNLLVPPARTFTMNSTVAVQSSAGGATVNVSGGGRVVFNGEFRPSNLVLNAGVVEFNRANGNSRIGNSTTVIGDGTSSATVLVGNTTGSATGTPNPGAATPTTSTVTVNNHATLGGTGTIASSVTANPGSTLIPGVNAIGSLALGSLVLSAATTVGEVTTPATKIIWEANNPIEADSITVTGDSGLTINGGVIYLYNPGTTDPLTATGTFNLINYTGTLNGAGLESLVIHPDTRIEGRNYILAVGAQGITLRITIGDLVQRSWDVDASGSWSTAANWTADTVPDAVSVIANITGASGASFTAPRTVTLDSARTVGQLILDSTQPVTLAGASTLTLDDGSTATLNANGADHLVSTPLALTTGGVLATVETGRRLTLSGAVSGTGVGIVKSGAGTLLLTADNSYTGNTSVFQGTLQIGDGGSTGSVAGALLTSGNTTVRFNRAGSLDLPSVISGAGSVEFLGAGDRTLSAANTYSGPTTLSAGTLVLANSLALQNSTLNYSTTGGSLVVAEPLTAVTLGGLSGDRAFPLTNTLGTPLALTVGGNNASTVYTGSPLGSGASFTKNGTGSLTLNGTHAYTGNTLVNAGALTLGTGASFSTAAFNLGVATARLVVNEGAAFNASGLTTITNASAGISVTGGVANFTGGIINTPNDNGVNFVSLTGGTVNIGRIDLRRSGANASTTEPTGGSTSNGLYIHGATVHVAGAFDLGVNTNSGVSSRIDSGSLTVDGVTTIAINSPDRWAVLDINGGAFTSTHTDQGVLLGGILGAASGNVVMHVRNGVAKVPRIQFGQAAFGGKSYLSLGGGQLYVGSGGLTLGSTNPALDARLRLGNGTLGATADWSSTLPVTLQGVPSVLTGADEANTPRTITLHGLTTGSGDIAKNGAGTVRFTNPANAYNGGAIIVNGGTLGLAGNSTGFGEFSIHEGGKFEPIGVFTTGTTVALNGGLSIGYNASASVPVSRIESAFDINLGANATLSISGTGTLPGPAYVLVKSAFGISGTFAPGNVTGIPAGFVLDQAYDDDANAATPPVIALVGSGVVSPYESWTASYSLTGNDALLTADPDADGMNNLLEYALDTSPVLGDTASAFTLGRSGNHLTLAFDQPGDSTITYAIEATNDLATPFSVIHTFTPFTTEGAELFTDTAVDLTVTPRRFLRLKVTKAP